MNWETILAVAGGVVVLGNCIKTLGSWLAPAKKLTETVAEHERKLANDDKRLKQQEADNQMMLRCLFALVNHDIDGNGIERLKATREELQDYITNR
jgi:hypothetical protein